MQGAARANGKKAYSKKGYAERLSAQEPGDVPESLGVWTAAAEMGIRPLLQGYRRRNLSVYHELVYIMNLFGKLALTWQHCLCHFC